MLGKHSKLRRCTSSASKPFFKNKSWLSLKIFHQSALTVWTGVDSLFQRTIRFLQMIHVICCHRGVILLPVERGSFVKLLSKQQQLPGRFAAIHNLSDTQLVPRATELRLLSLMITVLAAAKGDDIIPLHLVPFARLSHLVCYGPWMDFFNVIHLNITLLCSCAARLRRPESEDEGKCFSQASVSWVF